jgi:hypothetical protein
LLLDETSDLTRTIRVDFAGYAAVKDGIHRDGLHQKGVSVSPPLIVPAALRLTSARSQAV